MRMCVIDDDRRDPKERSRNETHSHSRMQSTRPIDAEDEAAGEELKHRRRGQNPQHGLERDGSSHIEQDDDRCPSNKEAVRDAFRNEEQKKEDEVEVNLVAERPALQNQHVAMRGNQQVGGKDVRPMSGARIDPSRIEEVRHQDDGRVNPVDRKDPREAMVDKRPGVGCTVELSNRNRGDDDPADDKEEIDSHAAELEDAKEVSRAVLNLLAAKVGHYHQHGRESTTDLNADDAF